MMQTVHYFYGYLQVAKEVGEPVTFSVPSGAFGNLYAGSLAREMGLPVGRFICANNQNACLHRIFSEGQFLKADLISCASSAIDIVVPYNFWRFLYFTIGQDPVKVSTWVREFRERGKVQFDPSSHQKIREGFVSYSLDDEETLATIGSVFRESGYLLDPHGAVAVAAALHYSKKEDERVLCLCTAHPAKFPEIIQHAIGKNNSLPAAAFHPTLERAKTLPEKVHHFTHSDLLIQLQEAMVTHTSIPLAP
jgi:threonine synthase